MSIIEIIILVLCILGIVISCLGLLICSIHILYCFVYEHKDWVLWDCYIDRVDEFIWNSENGRFEIPNTNVHAHIWENGLCSIHWDGDLLSTFDEYHSKKMAKLLMAKIK